MTFQPKRRFGQMLFNRNQRKRKNRVPDQCSSRDQFSSQANLLRGASKSEVYDSRKLTRSSMSKKHLNTDGSSCDQLKELLRKIPPELQVTNSPSTDEGFEEGREMEDNSSHGKTLKSDGSSGRELQLILEKLILEENRHMQLQIIPDSNEMQQKKISNYGTRTPPPQATRLSNNSTSPSTPNRPLLRQENPETPNSLSKFRFEMVDPNEQSKLFLKSRKNKGKRKRRTRKESRRGRTMLNNCGIVPGLEVRGDSMMSMSSCSIDSALDERSDIPMPPPRLNPPQEYEVFPENLSCNAFQLADDIRTTVSTW
eukprot:CAMPEP_0203666030 /NCGR_PEP_ID=MMETSP0090-20130426/3158_1 /ASSEMBLY_ACC=CAM_ASM_001088 /TAXON_ID=426623 /ORGANISM="Chaetoceros affinis, Strain CCMP159" /LENGTH=311 /DNA_ID=CAMNT_0050529809 /DNA_START=41 /DNA_END=973 /DNA_ORIENTATION=+